MRESPSGRRRCAALRRGNAAPTFLCLAKEKLPPQRWKRKRFRRGNLTRMCQVARKTKVVVAGACVSWKSSGGCAVHRWNQGSPPPHAETSNLLSWCWANRPAPLSAAAPPVRPGSAKRSGERGRRSRCLTVTTPKAPPHRQMRGSTITVPQRPWRT